MIHDPMRFSPNRLHHLSGGLEKTSFEKGLLDTVTTPGPGPPGIRPHWSLGGQPFYCPGPWGRSVGLALQGPDRWCDLPPLGIEGRRWRTAGSVTAMI